MRNTLVRMLLPFPARSKSKIEMMPRAHTLCCVGMCCGLVDNDRARHSTSGAPGAPAGGAPTRPHLPVMFSDLS